MNLKIDKKNTIIIGFGFFVILMVWQLYNQYCPIFLGELLKEALPNENDRYYIIGIIMALDNIFALFLLPIFGKLSDKTNTSMGKRMPYIFFGLIATAIAFPLIAVTYLNQSLIGLVLSMLLILVILNIYRSPVVALAPDITPKPLRSKVNGVINLIGYFGAIFGAALVVVFSINEENPFASYLFTPFIILSVMCIIIAFVLKFTINENKLLAEKKQELEYGESLTDDTVSKTANAVKDNRFNLIIILVASLFWYMSFNAVETFISTFSKEILGSTKMSGVFTIILTLSSIITFIPAGSLSVKFGRKNSILFGITLMFIAFLLLSFTVYSISTPSLILLIFMLGVGWATINVNSYPMVVELASKDQVGTYTGYYYFSTMMAQSLTPIFVGLIMSFTSVGLKGLFPYATLTMGFSLLIFYLVKSYSKVGITKTSGLSAFDTED